MKRYSVTRMRKECQTIYRMMLAEAVFSLVFSALCGALWKVLDDGETKAPLFFTGVFLVLSLFLLGMYFVVSDEKWMIKHTVYGKTLLKLGDAETLIQDIDREAEAMDYECTAFAIMPHWLVLYQPSSLRKWGEVQIQSRPIPASSIVRIGWDRETQEENAGFFVHITTADGAVWRTLAWENADIEALQRWSALQEKKEA